MRQHSDQAVFSRLIQECVLKVKLNLLVDIGAIERGPLRIVSHYLVADSIRSIAYALVRMSVSGYGNDIPLAAFAAPLRQAFGSIALSQP